MIEFTSVEIVPNPANAGQNLLISIGVEETGLSYQDVIAAISYTGTMSASQITYASGKKYAVFKFLSSGTVTISRELLADIFCVGGGGGGKTGHGGGGGYAGTVLASAISGSMSIVIGAGGVGVSDAYAGGTGGTSSFGSLLSKAGGIGGNGTTGGGNGGSGGGYSGYNGGSNGSDGGGTSFKGIGQHSTTKVFAEPDGELFSGGGGGKRASGGAGGGGNGGGTEQNGYPGTTNSGGGGGGGDNYCTGGNGGSGIVMIRVEIAA